jgi:hypothetical protein
MALDTRSRSTWRLETSIRSWHAAGRVIAGLRDLGAGTCLTSTLTSAVRDLIPGGRREFQAPRRGEADAGRAPSHG